VSTEKATPRQRKHQLTYRQRYFENKIAYDQLQVDRLKALGLSDALNEDIKKNPADFTSSIVDTLKRKTLEISNDKEASAGVVNMWMNLCLRAISFEQMQGLRERKMRLRELEVALRKEKFDSLKRTLKNSRLSDEQKAQRCREIFALSNEPKQTQANGENGFAP
jgi:hypothetical protein